ncbi:16L protein [Yaba-like disease virus]|uniref:16L protein n=1 Tax=Yaba-like disease virus TaxID=132475 RepID=Q9DHU6_YLDV|nr:16L protein [Yaba-like disease virus]CAC21254.1 16L protein [Yaba-like disease virus]
MENSCNFNNSIKNVIVFYINEKALIEEKKMLSCYENKLLNLIKEDCENIMLKYKPNLSYICSLLKVDDTSEENIKHIKDQIIESLENDNRPSVKLAIISLISMIVEMNGYKGKNIPMSFLIEDIALKISENSEDLINFINIKNKQKSFILKKVSYLFWWVSILCLLGYFIKNITKT